MRDLDILFVLPNILIKTYYLNVAPRNDKKERTSLNIYLFSLMFLVLEAVVVYTLSF